MFALERIYFSLPSDDVEAQENLLRSNKKHKSLLVRCLLLVGFGLLIVGSLGHYFPHDDEAHQNSQIPVGKPGGVQSVAVVDSEIPVGPQDPTKNFIFYMQQGTIGDLAPLLHLLLQTNKATVPVDLITNKEFAEKSAVVATFNGYTCEKKFENSKTGKAQTISTGEGEILWKPAEGEEEDMEITVGGIQCIKAAEDLFFHIYYGAREFMIFKECMKSPAEDPIGMKLHEPNMEKLGKMLAAWGAFVPLLAEFFPVADIPRTVVFSTYKPFVLAQRIVEDLQLMESVKAHNIGFLNAMGNAADCNEDMVFCAVASSLYSGKPEQAAHVKGRIRPPPGLFPPEDAALPEGVSEFLAKAEAKSICVSISSHGSLSALLGLATNLLAKDPKIQILCHNCPPLEAPNDRILVVQAQFINHVALFRNCWLAFSGAGIGTIYATVDANTIAIPFGTAAEQQANIVSYLMNFQKVDEVKTALTYSNSQLKSLAFVNANAMPVATDTEDLRKARIAALKERTKGLGHAMKFAEAILTTPKAQENCLKEITTIREKMAAENGLANAAEWLNAISAVKKIAKSTD